MSESEGLLGLLSHEVDPLRYHYAQLEPGEVTGMVVDRIPRGSRVLDVGCGTGSFLDLLRTHRGADVVGVEPNAERAQAARSRGHSVVTGYYDESSAAELGLFDVILFADVLEHMPHPGPVLRLASQWLAPGGCVATSMT
ncbi:class I SAM-dependent methyltransferase [Gemmatimonas sp.]|uniref:class I SAM-dependent methyltransferase n=1 Tax=Gemmatimonas sp. TaxID=1962908 RepID=UPI00356B084E